MGRGQFGVAGWIELNCEVESEWNEVEGMQATELRRKLRKMVWSE